MKIREELHFIDLTARMALRADASALVLGYFWWILEPLIWVAIFYLVFAYILDSPRADFLNFLIVGKLPFQWFSGGLTTCAQALVSAAGLVSVRPVPKSLLVLGKFQQTNYRQLAVFALLFVYLLLSGREAALTWCWVLLIAGAQFVLIAALGLIAAVMVCVAQDFSRVIQMFVIFMLFSSGIFWDVRSLAPDLQNLILTLNPMAVILDAYRQALLYNEVPDVPRLLFITGLFSGLSALMMIWIRNHETWLALRILSR